MDWTNFIEKILSAENCLDNLKINLDNKTFNRFSTPSVLKLSIYLINELNRLGENRIILVFPETEKSFFLLSVLKIIYDMLEGDIETIYDPAMFQKGQKLKCGNCVVMFDSLERNQGKTMLWVQNSQCKQGIPIEMAPFFQLTDTNRRLSSDKQFSITRSKIKKQNDLAMQSDSIVANLKNYQTHVKNTLFSLMQIGRAKDITSALTINNRLINDLLLIAQIDNDGNFDFINKGQLSGDPVFAFASNLYAIFEAIKKDSDVKSLFIDISSQHNIMNELDVLDELLKKNFPVIIFTDTSNSFDLGILEARGFLVWRWNEKSLTPKLIDNSLNALNLKLGNCLNHRIQYINCLGIEIDKAISMLYFYRKSIAESTANMQEIFEKLFILGYESLRNVTNQNYIESALTEQTLENCEKVLLIEKRFISDGMFADFQNIIEDFRTIFRKSFISQKYLEIESIIKSDIYRKICIVIPDKSDKRRHTELYYSVKSNFNIKASILVMTQSEYQCYKNNDIELTIVIGWLGKIMRHILYNYNSKNYIVLLYGCERKWKNAHTKSWDGALNRAVKIENLLKVIIEGNADASILKEKQLNIKEEPDEIEEIETTLRDNKYRKYVVDSGDRGTIDLVEAIPVNFVGGLLAFYKSTHKMISVTGIILSEEKDIKTIVPAEIKTGDFIVVRESKRDLIRDFADILLSKSGKKNLRQLASRWRETLELESVFSSFDIIYSKLRMAGCTKTQFTVRQWLNNEDIIAPQAVEDLHHIAEAMADEVLMGKLDIIFEASKEVKKAHIQAGKKLSELLRHQIAKKVQELDIQDPYNIWEPITLQIEEIGTVKILKVIDIGKAMMVDSSSTNYIIDES